MMLPRLLTRRFAVTGQRPLVLFISDFDPSGLDLERAWQAMLVGFGALGKDDMDACFLRIGLTVQQVEAHDLGRFGSAVKDSDSRAGRLHRGIRQDMLGGRRAAGLGHRGGY